MAILFLGMVILFVCYPVYTHFTVSLPSSEAGFNSIVNSTGQVPALRSVVTKSLIDPDTPQAAYAKAPFTPGQDEEMVLVFSDEFNRDGRKFFPGDDPYWEAVDLHYWGTNDLEWYDPSAATTRGGALHLTLTEENPARNHNLSYKSAMIQTWNKFCFTGGILEAAVRLPGNTNSAGLWPAVWAMGNLGRAGYGGSLDGVWPYSYDKCDVGTIANQTYPGTDLPEFAVTQGDPEEGGILSYLPGQRLSACTCPGAGKSHPGPIRSDGTYVGRAAPEIDAFEALVEDGVGMVSLSAQWGPYNAGYNWTQIEGETYSIWDEDNTQLNGYKGNAYQQTTSGLSRTNQNCYQTGGTGCFAVYGFEYKPGFDDGYITWVNDNKPAWTIFSRGLGPDELTEISERAIPVEPMYIIANLGFSQNFGNIDLESLTFPATMSIDYIRVYQPKNAQNIGCDPIEYPTAEYIKTYERAYTNPNITTWNQMGQPWPRNREALGGEC
ncbi:beta-glucan synthesis-associated [Coprinopsis marcescibilis]|uniref:Beta-glucan synthesis-associated n=1 Tax=Coprinopsis marcescibilis TaxID=230819 RepID=A0A5C3L3F7_COPMA|nr:beta-glucan synthesis-associated [Coprinopsis marcescibilis]